VKIAFTALFTLLVLVNVNNVQAQQARYITDTLHVPLRSGKGNQYRIVNRGLKSGTKVFILQEDAEGQWSQIKTSTGQEGWIRTQYLQLEPIASTQLQQASEKIQALENSRIELEKDVDEARQKNTDLNSQLLAAEKKSKSLQEELQALQTISSNAVSTHEHYQELTQQHQLLQTEMDVLKAENSRLESDSSHTSFMYGVAAVSFGIFLAIIVPVLRPRKRSSEWA
jgi:SH3 domain protein